MTEDEGKQDVQNIRLDQDVQVLGGDNFAANYVVIVFKSCLRIRMDRRKRFENYGKRYRVDVNILENGKKDLCFQMKTDMCGQGLDLWLPPSHSRLEKQQKRCQRRYDNIEGDNCRLRLLVPTKANCLHSLRLTTMLGTAACQRASFFLRNSK